MMHNRQAPSLRCRWLTGLCHSLPICAAGDMPLRSHTMCPPGSGRPLWRGRQRCAWFCKQCSGACSACLATDGNLCAAAERERAQQEQQAAEPGGRVGCAGLCVQQVASGLCSAAAGIGSLRQLCLSLMAPGTNFVEQTQGGCIGSGLPDLGVSQAAAGLQHMHCASGRHSLQDTLVELLARRLRVDHEARHLRAQRGCSHLQCWGGRPSLTCLIKSSLMP